MAATATIAEMVMDKSTFGMIIGSFVINKGIITQNNRK